MSVIDITFPGNLPQVSSASALRALPSTYIGGDALYYVIGLKSMFGWDGSSFADDDGLTVLRPNDITPIQAGRWLGGLADGTQSHFSYEKIYPDQTLGRVAQTQIYFSAWPGVDPTGGVDNGGLLQSFLDFCKEEKALPRIGRGTFLINTPVTISDWAGFSLVGDGIASSILKRTTSGTMLTVADDSRGTISDIAFDGTGMAAGGGIVVSGSGVGVINVIRCQFASFPGRGVYFNGTISNPFSSLDVKDNLFLSCGIIDGTPQMEARYTNDTEWSGNQYGTLALGGPYPTIGSYFYSCQAGNFSNNYHWENLTGAKYERCDYSRFDGNRWETNQHEGLIIKDSAFCAFGVNHVHTNGQATTNTYDSMVMQGCGETVLSGNSFYNFVGTSVLPRYCLTIDAACSSIRIGDTSFSGYGTAPVQNLAASNEVLFSNGYSAAAGVSQTNATVTRANSGVLTASQTSYCGPGTTGTSANAEGSAMFIMDYTGVHRQMRVVLDGAPTTSVTVTLRKNFADTGMTVTINNPAVSGVIATPISFDPNDQFSFKTVRASGSASGYAYISMQSDR